MGSKKKILFINRIYPPIKGASGRLLKDLVQGFVRAGWDVSVLTTADKNARSFEGPVTVYTAKANPKPRSMMSYAFVWSSLLRRLRALPDHDLVVSMTDPPLAVMVGAAAAKKLKAKHIHWSQDLYPDLLNAFSMKVPQFFYNSFEARSLKALKSADKIIAIGRCMAKRLIEKGIPAGQITYLPNWPDQELVEDQEGKALHAPLPDNARPEEEQIKENIKFRVLYAGTIGLVHPMKSIVEAAAILNESHSDIEFVFVGGGKMFDVLAQQRAARGLTNIRLIPFQPASHLQQVMESGDLHLIALKEEAKGMSVPSKLYAALAAQRPVVYVGPKGSEVDLILKDYKSGTRVPNGDGKTLAKVIAGFREDPDKWFTAHEGAKKAAEVFLPDNAIGAWVERAEAVVKNI